MARAQALLGVVVALVLVLPAETASARYSTALQAAPPALIKHVVHGSFGLPPSLSGGHIGGLALDSAGNIYAAVDRLQKPYIVVFDANGVYVRSWQAGGGTGGIYRIPLAIGPDGLIYIIPEESVGTVSVFTTDGTLIRQFGAGSNIRVPSDIEVDPSGNIYVTSFPNPAAGIQHDVVTRLDPSGAVTGQWQPLPGGGVAGGGSPPKLRGIAVAPDGTMWVTTADLKDPLLHLDANGQRVKTWDPALVIPGSGPAQFRDVDYANDKLYFGGYFSAPNGAHYLNALAVVSPEGRLLDEVLGSATYLAVGAQHVYLDGQVYGSASVSALSADETVTDLAAEPTVLPTKATGAFALCATGEVESQKPVFPPNTADMVLPHGGSGCDARYLNQGSPCPKDLYTFVTPFLGGREAGHLKSVEDYNGTPLYFFEFSADEVASGSGSVLVKWDCFDPATGVGSTRWEYKGAIYLLDPSGAVFDSQTGRPIGGATVRLQVSPVAGQPFGTPGISAYTPQLNPETTGPKGEFAWDVAPGRWRLRVTAYGYRTFVSKTYKVPPAVTHLRLQLTPDPRTQRLLIDPAGRVGAVRLRGKPTGRVTGVRIVLARHRVRAIMVNSKRFRTALAIQLGSTELDLQRAYPQLLKTAGTFGKKTTRQYRVKHATFTVRHGRVRAIKLS
jgi:DNA-binding beta-propeller fold protein YncE